MEFVRVLLPFFTIGFLTAVTARFTGTAISMLMLPSLLYMGATPIEAVAFMLTFVLYNNFTQETQDVRLNRKEMTFFGGWKLVIPVAISVVAVPFFPAAAVGFFTLCFVMELAAALYKRLPENKRPTPKAAAITIAGASVVTAAGVFLIPLIPADEYFLPAGSAILIMHAFARYAGERREAFRGTWRSIWCGFYLFLGLFGIEASSYPRALGRRFKTDNMESMFPIVTVFAALVGMLTVFVVYGEFSIPALIGAIGAAIGVRLFGVYRFSENGSFSYTAIGMAFFAVLCLYLVSPDPVGFTELKEVFRNAQ